MNLPNANAVCLLIEFAVACRYFQNVACAFDSVNDKLKELGIDDPSLSLHSKHLIFVQWKPVLFSTLMGLACPLRWCGALGSRFGRSPLPRLSDEHTTVSSVAENDLKFCYRLNEKVDICVTHTHLQKSADLHKSYHSAWQHQLADSHESHVNFDSAARDFNPGPIFSIPGFGIETFLIPGLRHDS
jgi:hypothetical protein